MWSAGRQRPGGGSRSSPGIRRSTRKFCHLLNNPSVTVPRMLPFRVFTRPIPDIRAGFPPFDPSVAPRACTPATRQTVWKHSRPSRQKLACSWKFS
jgi:hypothetical protein